MIVIDPLKLKIQELLVAGSPFPYNQAIQRYGTMSDIELLTDEIETVKATLGERRHIYIDLTPFDRIGHLSEMIKALVQFNDPRPVLLVMSEDIVLSIAAEYENIPLIIVVYGPTCEYNRIEGGTHDDRKLKLQVEKEILVHNSKTLRGIRAWFREHKLTRLLFEPNCLDIPSPSDESTTITYISGTYYRRMPNKMLVSSYLNLKQIGRDFKGLTTLAYEVVLELVEFFNREINALDNFDVLVTPNNTALFLASSVQAILEKPVIAIDRLGPIPALQLQSERLRRSLQSKKVIVIEEVVATGNEVDRTVLFLNHIQAEIVRFITLYNLDVGMPMLIKSSDLTSLCRPKEELKYVYRSE